MNSTGWYDSGVLVPLSATPNNGWELAGWTGTGNGAYSGRLNQTSVQANGAFSENATFYPGLKITSGDNGAVAYSYGTNTGTVPPGQSVTLYAPIQSKISLSAEPSSLLYVFNGWNPISTGNSGQETLTLESPSTVQASFSLNLVAIGGIAGVIIVVVAGSILALRSRTKPPIIGG